MYGSKIDMLVYTPVIDFPPELDGTTSCFSALSGGGFVSAGVVELNLE